MHKNGKIDVLSASQSCNGTTVNLLTDAGTAANAALLGGLGPEAFAPKAAVYTRVEADAAFLGRAGVAADAVALNGLAASAYALNGSSYTKPESDVAFLGKTDTAANASALNGLGADAFMQGSVLRGSLHLGASSPTYDLPLPGYGHINFFCTTLFADGLGLMTVIDGEGNSAWGTYTSADGHFSWFPADNPTPDGFIGAVTFTSGSFTGYVQRTAGSPKVALEGSVILSPSNHCDIQYVVFMTP